MKISELTPHPRNAEHRAISDRAMKGLIESIRIGSSHHDSDCFRLDTSITVNSKGNRILGGHRRVEALSRLGQDFIHDDDITWVDYEPNSADELACVIKLNSPAIAGEYTEGLDAMLLEINDAMPDISDSLLLTELLSDEGMKLLAGESLGDPDEVPEPPEEPITKPGDLWLLGVYFECESCGKKYDYNEGLAMKECPCG
jgi:hypothetical protein